MDTDNWDNGTYIIKGWNIKDRLYKHYADEKLKDMMFENLEYVNSKQPKEEQLDKDVIKNYAEKWEEQHLDRLSDDRKEIVEKRILEKAKEDEQNLTEVKEQVVPYEVLEKSGTVYELKGGGEHDR
jgi:aminopeptidase-like protein